MDNEERYQTAIRMLAQACGDNRKSNREVAQELRHLSSVIRLLAITPVSVCGIIAVAALVYLDRISELSAGIALAVLLYSVFPEGLKFIGNLIARKNGGSDESV